MLLLNIYISYFGLILIFPLCQVQSAEKAAKASYATSVIGMVKLLDRESQLIDSLSDYAKELTEKLQLLQSAIPKMRLENDKAQSDKILYLSNPLNAFSLIRRLQSEWTEWRTFMERPVGKTQMRFYDKLQGELPTKLDLNEACEAFRRLQNTYDLKVKDMIQGKLKEKHYDATLSILDIYAAGEYFFKEKDYEKAAEWLQESCNWLQMNSLPSLPINLNRLDAFQMLAQSYAKTKNYSQALGILEIALVDHKHNANLLRLKNEVNACLTKPAIAKKPQKSKVAKNRNVINYKNGCNDLFAKGKNNLHCFYNTTTTPFLRLAPFKMEILSLSPYIVVFHDVLSAGEMHQLQTAATPKLRRATTYTFGDLSVSKERTTNDVFVGKGANEVNLRIVRRINQMTGFNLGNADGLDIMNYGMGGHYSSHYDYFNMKHVLASNQTTAAARQELIEKGDRIATILFYLSDVDQGGATVFPRVEKAVFPKKGTALLWYNLHHDGQVDPLTMHAACPVLVGSKWVMTMWIRERGQHFIRPCLRV